MSNRENQLAELWAKLSTDAADARLLLRQATASCDPDLHAQIEPQLNKPVTCQRIAELLISRGRDRPALGEALVQLRDGQKELIYAAFPSLQAPQPTAAPAPLQLKRWTEPAFPLDRPWPGLGHCVHPAQLGGREVELGELCAQVTDAQQPILLLYADSGVGKSSLLDAGLRARLAKGGRAVALDRRPAHPGLLGRLGAQLVTAPPSLQDDDLEGFFALLGAVGELAGHPPVLILDQAEDLLRDDAGKARLGPLLAAAAASEAARWVLAYRHEHHAAMLRLLREPLAYAGPRPGLRAAGVGRDHYLDLPLLPLGRREGARFDEYVVIKAFADAALGAPDSPLRRGEATVGLREADAQRLGVAFARARKAEGGDALPLTPELQVVLDALRAEAVDAGSAELRVPKASEALDALVDGALEKHLLKHLRELTLAQGEHAAEARTAGLLLLSALTDVAGRRRAVERGALLGARGPMARQLCDGLAGAGRWLIVEAADPDTGQVWLSLPHDSLARAVFGLVSDPAKAAKFGLSAGLLDLDRVVRARVAVADSDPDAHHLSAAQVAQIEQQQDVLVVGDRARAWWAKVLTHRRAEARRELEHTVRRKGARDGAPLRALRRLQVEHGLSGAELIKVVSLGADLDEERRDRIFGEGPRRCAMRSRPRRCRPCWPPWPRPSLGRRAKTTSGARCWPPPTPYRPARPRRPPGRRWSRPWSRARGRRRPFGTRTGRRSSPGRFRWGTSRRTLLARATSSCTRSCSRPTASPRWR
jgi:hypothetical protein